MEKFSSNQLAISLVHAHEDENSMDHTTWTSLLAACKPQIPNLWPKFLKFYTTNLKQNLAANHILGGSFGTEAVSLAAQEMICSKLLAQCQRASSIRKLAKMEKFSSNQLAISLVHAQEVQITMDHSTWTSLSATCKPQILKLWPRILKYYTTNLKQKLAANHLLGSQRDSFGAEATPLAAQEMICNKLLAQCQRASTIRKSIKMEKFPSN